jgi:hypothetical protein
MRPRRLEVEEVLGLDLGEFVGVPDLREVAAGERSPLATVVPAAKRGDQERRTQGGPLDDAKFVSDARSLRSV